MPLQVPGSDLTPEERLEHKQLRRSLFTAVHKLPKKYRMVLVLRDMEGLSAKEVGAVMGLTERAVKSRLHRARLFVRHELNGQRSGWTGRMTTAGEDCTHDRHVIE